MEVGLGFGPLPLILLSVQSATFGMSNVVKKRSVCIEGVECFC